jgi:hypothetical protein
MGAFATADRPAVDKDSRLSSPLTRQHRRDTCKLMKGRPCESHGREKQWAAERHSRPNSTSSVPEDLVDAVILHCRQCRSCLFAVDRRPIYP